MSRLKRDRTAEPVREIEISRANGDREIFLVQLTTSRIDNLTRLIHTLWVMTIHTPPKGERRMFPLMRRDNGDYTLYISSVIFRRLALRFLTAALRMCVCI